MYVYILNIASIYLCIHLSIYPSMYLCIYRHIEGVQEKLCFFQKFSKFCHLSLASTGLLFCIGCRENVQPIGVSVHSNCV